MIVTLPSKHDSDFLSLKCGCTGSSSSKLVKIPHCWKSYILAHMYIIVFTDVRDVLIKLLYHLYMFTDIRDVTIKLLKDITYFQF